MARARLALIAFIALLIIWVSPPRSNSSAMIEGTAAPPTEITEAPPIPSAGGPSFPLENFTRYTSPFGYRQHPMGGTRFHYGLDIAAPMGSPIRNWADGVASVGSDGSCGTYVRVQSGEWSHVYCHMGADSVEVGEGQAVKAGDRLGRVGMTGSTTGPHLHWGIKYQGVWVDPAIVLRAMVG